VESLADQRKIVRQDLTTGHQRIQQRGGLAAALPASTITLSRESAQPLSSTWGRPAIVFTVRIPGSVPEPISFQIYLAGHVLQFWYVFRTGMR